MGNMFDLANKIEAFAARQADVHNERAKAAAYAILKYLIETTPADTTKAVSNWRVGVGTPPQGTIEAYVPGRLGYTVSASGKEALAVGKARIDEKRPGEVLYISNAVDYIGKLNQGSSKQAPAGFVEASLIMGAEAARVKLK